MTAPTIADIEDAAARLKGQAHRTPLIETTSASPKYSRIFLKTETEQRTGSFKFRGAYNRISRVDDAAKAAGVTAYSSGNHAQAVACVAKLLGIPAVIVMPEDAPAKKLNATKRFGAEVITYNRWTESREDIAHLVAKKRGMTIIPPFDDPLIIAGQGTVGLEIADDMKAQGLKPDLLLVPASGGGLVSGCAIAIKDRFPDCRVFSVEPENFDDIARSLAAGKRVSNAPNAENSICDALLVPTPGAITFPIMQELLEGGLTVSDDTVRNAMHHAWKNETLTLEPGGAVALAALLEEAAPAAKIVVAVCSGGNVDDALFRAVTGK